MEARQSAWQPPKHSRARENTTTVSETVANPIYIDSTSTASIAVPAGVNTRAGYIGCEGLGAGFRGCGGLGLFREHVLRVLNVADDFQSSEEVNGI